MLQNYFYTKTHLLYPLNVNCVNVALNFIMLHTLYFKKRLKTIGAFKRYFLVVFFAVPENVINMRRTCSCSLAAKQFFRTDIVSQI